MKKFNSEKANQAVKDWQLEQEQNAIRLKEILAKGDFLDDDGYPTDDALEAVRIWHWNDQKGWFEFIKSIWHLASWGWHEGEEDHEWDKGKKVYRYNISTAGWSGNESIIHAMEQCGMMWGLSWIQSRRGGHYIFELYNFRDDDDETT